MVEGFKDVLFLKEKAFTDDRGEFVKFFDKEVAENIQFEMCQQNYVITKKAGTFRGLHYQKDQHAEAKIFRVLKGRVQLVFFDIRQNSDTHEKTGTVVLDVPQKALYLPKGFATGYLTLEDDTHVLYMSDNHYHPESEEGLNINDPAINIDLMIQPPEVSAKDRNWPSWK